MNCSHFSRALALAALLCAASGWTSVSALTPVHDTFEPPAYTVGDLPQGAWTAPVGRGYIQAETKFEGAQALAVDLASQVDRAIADADNDNVVWIDGYIYAGGESFCPDAQDAAMIANPASSLLCFNSQSGIQAFNGNKQGGGAWVDTGVTSGIGGSPFVRVTIRQDYSTHTWDLYLNETRVPQSPFGFKNAIAKLNGLRIETGQSAQTYLDNLRVTTSLPSFVTPSPTPTATPPPAQVAASVVSGDPCTDGEFVVEIALSNNNVGAVGTYSFEIAFDASKLSVGPNAVTAADFAAAPSSSQTNGMLRVSAFDDNSALMNGSLFRVRFTVINPGNPGTLNITVADYGPTPLLTTMMAGLAEIPHVFDNAAVTGLCPSEDTATPTPVSPTATPTFTNTATNTVPAGAATIVTTIDSGDPCEGASFTVAVGISDNTVGPVGTYAFALLFDGTALSVGQGAVVDGQFGAAPSVGATAGGISISAFNDNSTLVNGTLFKVTFTVANPGATGPLSIAVMDFGPTPLLTTLGANLQVIPHTFDNSAVTGLCEDVVATATPTSATDTPTSTPPISGAVVSATIIDGDPCSGSTITVALNVAGNAIGPVGTYAFEISFDPAVLSFVSAADAGLGAAPSTSLQSPGRVAVSAFEDNSTFVNGRLVTMVFTVLNPGATGVYSLAAADFGPTPLSTTLLTGLLPIEHGFDNSAVTGLCGQATPTATLTAAPTSTPTPSPIPVDVPVLFKFSKSWYSESDDPDLERDGEPGVTAGDLLLYIESR